MSDIAPVADSDADKSRHGSLIEAAWAQVEYLTRIDRSVSSRRAASDARMTLPPDAFPGYRLIGEIHRGGQGIVYKAVQESTGRSVALKLMREGPFASPSERARFEREVRILGKLKHPNIVSILDSDEVGQHFFYVMDFIDGEPLDAYVRKRKPTIDETMRLFVAICDAIAAAHQLGVIHRDLKPGNVRVDRAGVPHLLDFGLSKIAGDPAAISATRSGQFVGTIPWTAPEQAASDADAVDVRTDVYSLGVLLFEMLTGRFPYDVTGSAAKVLANVLKAEPARPRSIRREIPEDVETIVLKCLQKERGRRYQSAGDLAADVRRYLEGEPLAARRDSAWYVIRKRVWRYRLPLAIGLAFVTLLAASSIVAWWLYADSLDARTIAERRGNEATERLWDSRLAQARAARYSHRFGRRFEALGALRDAARIRPSIELRNEALAALALTDFEVLHTINGDARFSAAGLDSIDRFASCTSDGRIEVRTLADDRVIARLQGPPFPGWAQTFSPDGRFLATKHHAPEKIDYQLWLWDLERGEMILRIEPGDYQHGGIAFGPDSRWVALTRADLKIHFYELPSGRPLSTIARKSETYRIAVDPQERRLAMASFEKPFLEVWNLERREVEWTPELPYGAYAVSWSADGTRLAVGCANGRVYSLDLQTRAPLEVGVHQKEVIGAWFDPKMRFVASVGWDNMARFWDPDSGQAILDPQLGWNISHVSDLLTTDIRPSGFLVARYEPAREFRRATPRTGKWRTAGFSADGDSLLLTGDPGVWLWDLNQDQPNCQLSDEAMYAAYVTANGIVGLDSRGIWRWPMPASDGTAFDPQPDLVLPADGFMEMSVTPDGRFAAVRARDGLVVVDLAARCVISDLPRYRGMREISISPDGQWVFSGTWRGEPARVRDARTGDIALEIPGYNVSGFFSACGKWLMVSERAEYTLYRAPGWTVAARLPRLELDMIAGETAFTRDGETAAISTHRYETQLIDLPSARPLAVLPNPTLDSIVDLVYRPDGGMLAAVTENGLVQVLDIGLMRERLRELNLDW